MTSRTVSPSALPRLAFWLVMAWGSVAPVWAADGCANQAAVMPAVQALPEQAPGLGGTGATAGRPGLGGTGIVAGGLGGTGIDAGGVGGTGIVGIITGFASVCVNGLEVQFDATTPVAEDGRAVPLGSLAVGQLVAIQAVQVNGQGGELVARSIAVLHTLVGPVDSIQGARGEMQVLGQTVLLRAQTQPGLQVGQWVQVSGYRRADGHIEASFLAPLAPQPLARMTGLLERNLGVDVVVGGTAVHLGDTRLPQGVGRGSELGIRGTWDGATLHAVSLQAEPTQKSLGAVKTLVLEGLVHAVGARSISLGQHVLSLDRDLQVLGGSLRDVAVNQRVRLSASLDAQHQVHVHRLEIRASSERFGSRERRVGQASRSGEAGSGKDASGSDDSTGSSDSSGRSGGSDDSASSGSGSSPTSSLSSSGSGSSGSSGSSGGSGSGSGGSSGGSGSGSGGSSGGSGSKGGSGGGGSGSGKGK